MILNNRGNLNFVLFLMKSDVEHQYFFNVLDIIFMIIEISIMGILPLKTICFFIFVFEDYAKKLDCYMLL